MHAKKRTINSVLFQLFATLVALLLVTSSAFAAEMSVARSSTTAYQVPVDGLVTEDEAVAVADLWYARELNRLSGPLATSEIENRLSMLDEQSVFYLVSEERLLEQQPDGEQVLAYVITYQPSGYVVVAGNDRLEPVIVFSAEAEFSWDPSEENFLRYFLNRDLPKRWQSLEDRTVAGTEVPIHPHWTNLRSALDSTQNLQDANFVNAPDDILVELDTAVWGQSPFYNDLVITNNGNTSGIPTGCTATAMAIKMRYHEWPLQGVSSHSYTDTFGSVQFSHSVNFATQTYDWSAMPTTDLTAANNDVAALMYHAGVAVDMDYEVGNSAAWPTTASMNTFFGYKGTVELFSGHDNPIRDSVRGGLPVVISSSAHTVLVDGYRDTPSPYFHLNAGWSGTSDGWYNLDQIPASDPTIDRSYPYSAPSHYYYVNQSWTGTENGNLQTPYNTLAEGVTNTPTYGYLWLKTGSYTGPVTFTKAMTISSYEGPVTLGE